jgi:AcrR family transcriptional regulator
VSTAALDAVYVCQSRAVDNLSERLVSAGVDLLDEEGISAISIRAVSRICEVSHGAPRRYFPTLAALLAAIAETCFNDLEQRITAAGTGSRKSAEVYVEFARSRPDAFELMSRHDLLNASGRNLRRVSLPVLEHWVHQHSLEHPTAGRTAAIAAWVGVHGIATLASRRGLDIIGVDADTLLAAVLGRDVS